MIKLNDVGTLIASVPYMIGFHPANSVVVMGIKEGFAKVTVRTDLPEPGQDEPLVTRFASVIGNQGCDGAILVVFGGSTTDGELPCTSLIRKFGDYLSVVGIKVIGAYWVAEAAAGAAWGCYCGDVACDRAGTLPDPAETELAANNAVAGLVTLPAREDLNTYVRPADERDLSQRATLIERETSTWTCSPSSAFALVRNAVADFVSGVRSLDDTTIARLALALQDQRVRDASASLAVGDDAIAAEGFFLMLTRECPNPHRVEAAVLAALSAYVRGDGALAAVVLATALEISPNHRFAQLLRTAFDEGIPNTVLAEIAYKAANKAKSLLGEPDAGSSPAAGNGAEDRK